MTTPLADDLCRVTVVGPAKRADLAVPVGLPLSGLLPVLLEQTGGDDPPGPDERAWVLQRLGGDPFDPTGTPETLDWHEGEELHLRRAEEAVPPAHVDDVAVGMAVAMSGGPGRWRPEYGRRLFLAAALGVLVVLALALTQPAARTVTPSPVLCAVVAALVLGAGAVQEGRSPRDRGLLMLLALGACGFSGLAGTLATAPTLVGLAGGALLGTAVGVSTMAALLLLARVLWSPELPFVTLGVLVAPAVVVGVDGWLDRSGAGPVGAAGVIAAATVLVAVFAPRLSVRLAQLRGPQLPWNSEQLQENVDPMTSGEVTDRTRQADGLLTVFTVSAAGAIVFSGLQLAPAGGFATLMVGLVSVAALVRSRQLRGVWQRSSMVAAGLVGMGSVVLALSGGGFPAEFRGFLLVFLVGAFAAVLRAALRPGTQRLLPIWGHLANGVELLSAAAVLPVLLQLLGVYALVSGLVS